VRVAQRDSDLARLLKSAGQKNLGRADGIAVKEQVAVASGMYDRLLKC
jgi:hypothetical protein